MKTDELIKSLRICQDFSKSCKDCYYGACDSGCLNRILASAAERLNELSVALEMARAENTAFATEAEKRRWIPVSERLPEQGQEVIVYDGGVLKPKVYCYLFWNPNYDNWARVTHWMPLPEPPKDVNPDAN